MVSWFRAPAIHDIHQCFGKIAGVVESIAPEVPLIEIEMPTVFQAKAPIAGEETSIQTAPRAVPGDGDHVGRIIDGCPGGAIDQAAHASHAHLAVEVVVAVERRLAQGIHRAHDTIEIVIDCLTNLVPSHWCQMLRYAPLDRHACIL